MRMFMALSARSWLPSLSAGWLLVSVMVIMEAADIKMIMRTRREDNDDVMPDIHGIVDDDVLNPAGLVQPVHGAP
jgi:hypothetical protein